MGRVPQRVKALKPMIDPDFDDRPIDLVLYGRELLRQLVEEEGAEPLLLPVLPEHPAKPGRRVG